MDNSFEVAEICFCGHTDNLRFCGRCKQVKYCSTLCQRYDWKSHKYICPPAAPSATDATASSTSASSIRAIYFPPDAPEPRLIQLPLLTVGRAGTSRPMHHEFDYKAIFPRGTDRGLQSINIDKNPVSGRDLTIPVTGPAETQLDLTHHLLLKFHPTRVGKPNLCIETLCGANSAPAYPWYGPVLCTFRPYMLDPPQLPGRGPTTGTFVCREVQLRDLRTAVDFFRTYGLLGEDLSARVLSLRKRFTFRGTASSGTAMSDASDATGSNRVRVDPYSTSPGFISFRNQSLPPGVFPPRPGGVATLYCLGDISILQSPRFKESDLFPISVTEIQSRWPISPISAQISLPLQVYKIPPKPQHLTNPNWSPENEVATSLFRDPGTGVLPREWDRPGSVMIARLDGKKLYKEHAKAVCLFCGNAVEPLLELWIEQGKTEPVGSRMVDKILTKEGFEEWFEGYRGMMAREAQKTGEEFNEARWVSPYEVLER